MRLIDADAVMAAHCKDCNTDIQAGCKGDPVCASMMWIVEAPTVDAVEVEKYKALLEMYHELRENFVDFVCSGVPNVAPYCLNRCDGCCDAYGWCRQSDKCQGFNPAEVILDGGQV